jgi:hypothetical protein
LAARGELAQAIKYLTNANRTRRDRRIEARLLDLRFDGFNDAEWPQDRPP